MLPVQYGAPEQQSLEAEQPAPAGWQAGGPHTPELHARPGPQSPFSMQCCPVTPGVRWQVVGAPAVAPRQYATPAQHSFHVAHAMPTHEVMTPASLPGVPASLPAIPASGGVVPTAQFPA